MGKSYSHRYNIGHTYKLDGYMWLVVREYTQDGKPRVTMKCLGKAFETGVPKKYHQTGEDIDIANPIGRIFNY